MYDYDRRTFSDRLAHTHRAAAGGLSPEVAEKAVRSISKVTRNADEAVRALEFSSSDLNLEILEKETPGLVALGKWLVGRKEREGQYVANYARIADELAEQTSFWNRPVMLGKGDYVTKIKGLVKKLHEAQREVLSAFRMSGVWSPAGAH